MAASTAGSWLQASREIASRKSPYKIQVAFQKIQRRKRTDVHPANLLENACSRFALVFVNSEEQEMNGVAARVIVFIARELAVDRRFNLQFLAQFPHQRFLGRFAVLNLPARELPFIWMAVILLPLPYQDLPITVDDGCGHKQRRTVSHCLCDVVSALKPAVKAWIGYAVAVPEATNCRRTYGRMPPLR